MATLALSPLLACAAAQAQVPLATQVADVCTEASALGSSPSNFWAVGSSVVFTAYADTDGIAEIWTTDGTPAGTQRLVHPEVFLGFTALHPLGGRLLGGVLDASNGLELWTTDGTTAGTAIVKDLMIGPESGFPTAFAGMGGLVYFTTQEGPAGIGGKLWSSDGTTVGTTSLGEVGSGYEIVSLDTLLVFTASGGIGDLELWASDGTAIGTLRIADIYPGDSSSAPSQLTRFGALVICAARNAATGAEPWITDGTTAGTRLLSDIFPGPDSSYASDFVADGARAFFVAEDGASGRELWVTDGTALGTMMVADVRPGPFGSSASSTCAWGGRVYFSADDGVSGPELWASDGSVGGTTLLADIRPGAAGSAPSGLAVTPWGVVFAADDGISGIEPWITDGTPAGTRRLADAEPGPGSASPHGFKTIGANLYFAATSGGSGDEPWVSDGTAAGTLMLANVAPDGSPSWPHDMLSTNGRAYFQAYDGSAHGGEPWMTDGTAPGTLLAADIAPGPDSSWARPVASTGSRIICLESSGGETMWSIDALGGDPQPLGQLINNWYSNFPDLATTSSGIAFTSVDPAGGEEPFLTDGQPGGTSMLADLLPGAGSSDPRGWTTTSSGAVFFATTDGSSYLLMATDCSASGTAALDPPVQVSPGSTLTWGDGRTVLFSGIEAATGLEPWISDGTPAGTHLVADLTPGSDSTWLVEAAPFRGGYLFAADAGLGREPWFTDGTPTGTRSLGDLLAGPQSSIPTGFVDAGAFALFAAGDGVRGTELWRTDGSAVGTIMVKDIFAGPSGSAPLNLVVIAPGQVVFTANDGALGRELWISDGTDAGTRPWAEVRPGRASGWPHELVVVGDKVLFVADGGDGAEVFRVPLPVEALLCSNGIDDDGDGRLDCADSDCVADAACVGADFDGDGVPNGADCAPLDPGAFAQPAEIGQLTLERDPARTDTVRIGWPDPSGLAGSATRTSVATTDLTRLRTSDWDCLTSDAVSPILDSRPGTWVYLARASNSCGPFNQVGWGSDSSGAAPAISCP